MERFNGNFHDELKKTNHSSQLKRKFYFAIGGMTLVFFITWIFSTYIQVNTISFYRIYRYHEFIGTISSLEEVERFYAKRLQQEKAKHPNVHIKLDRQGIRMIEDSGFKATPTTAQTIVKLDKLTTAYAEGVKLKVNGKTIGYVKDKATAEKIWKRIKSKYASPTQGKNMSKEVQVLSLPKRSGNVVKAISRVESVKFQEQVSIEENVNIPPERIVTFDEAIRKLMMNHIHKVKYTVKRGDTISSIAKAMNVSPQTIYRNYPFVGEGSWKKGQVLDLSESKPLINVKTVQIYTEYIVIKPEKVMKKDPTMRSGRLKVVQEGKSGRKRRSYRLTSYNGKIKVKEWIDQEVIEPSIPKIVICGTKIIRNEGIGSFAFPVRHTRVTSKFGRRGGEMHNGIDIISSNRLIQASNKGKVLFSGTKSGYGICIIINHGKRYKTSYAHLDKTFVNVGDMVEKGQNIGLMGNTGNSTGTHLHFELSKNGIEQNPLKYLTN